MSPSRTVVSGYHPVPKRELDLRSFTFAPLGLLTFRAAMTPGRRLLLGQLSPGSKGNGDQNLIVIIPGNINYPPMFMNHHFGHG